MINSSHIEELHRLVGKKGLLLERAGFGYIGDGGVHFNLILAKDDPRLADEAFEAALRELVFSDCVKDFQGSFSAEHALGRKNQKVYDRYTAAQLRPLSALLKQTPLQDSSDRSICEAAESRHGAVAKFAWVDHFGSVVV